MTRVSDFRSDTVTKPTAAMRSAMAAAEVGDDVLGHDPTVLELENLAAEIMDMESALFFPSGTMANLTALSTHCLPGHEVILEEWAHTARFEGGGAGSLAHVQVRTLGSDRGHMDADEVAYWISPGSEHTPPTALVCLEQTHNFHGGAVVPLGGLRAVHEVAKRGNVAVHLDGARIFNAVAASGVAAAEYAACADTVSFCLSKGLGAPVGSLLCGSSEFLQRARWTRKRLGGGMRQGGILAAAGLIALGEMRERLAEDNARAKRLAETLAAASGYEVDPGVVDTNIVFVETPGQAASDIVEAAAAENILLYATGPRQIRLVTHFDVDDTDAERLLTLLARLAESATST